MKVQWFLAIVVLPFALSRDPDVKSGRDARYCQVYKERSVHAWRQRSLTVVNKPDCSESPQRSEDFKRKAGLKTAKTAEPLIF